MKAKWKSMEIAPQNGTEILVYGPTGECRMCVAYWGTTERAWMMRGIPNSQMSGLTHWTEVPEPPAIELLPPP